MFFCFRPPLISKGLRRASKQKSPQARSGFRPPLISKGLRLLRDFIFKCHFGFRPPLISKGLRLEDDLNFCTSDTFQATPDFKGIKTGMSSTPAICASFQATPDFKGIKTAWPCQFFACFFVSGHLLIPKRLERAMNCPLLPKLTKYWSAHGLGSGA